MRPGSWAALAAPTPDRPDGTDGTNGPPPATPGAPDRRRRRGRRPRSGRPWSARRSPAALVGLVVGGASGALLYDEIAVHTGHHPQAWRTWTADQLAHRSLDDRWAVAAAALACALGLWLLLLATTPGLRRLLPLQATGTAEAAGAAGTPGLRAALDRRSAAVMLRRAALETPGVRTARVAVGRRRARVRVAVSLGDRRQIHDDLTVRLDAERERLALVRPPRVRITIRGRS